MQKSIAANSLESTSQLSKKPELQLKVTVHRSFSTQTVSSLVPRVVTGNLDFKKLCSEGHLHVFYRNSATNTH
jgi:hypothetical protein